MSLVDRILEDVLRKEGGYVDHPNDRGGPTNWGITQAVARANGYTGAMKDLPRATALEIYRKQFVTAPGFDRLIPISEAIAAELVDTGVNMGPKVAAEFLQRCLNVLNDQGRKWKDIAVDGAVGPGTASAMRSFFLDRGHDAERVLLRMLNSLQGARYIAIAEARAANESFVFGWFANRVQAA